MTAITIALIALSFVPARVPPARARRDDWMALAAAVGVEKRGAR